MKTILKLSLCLLMIFSVSATAQDLRDSKVIKIDEKESFELPSDIAKTFGYKRLVVAAGTDLVTIAKDGSSTVTMKIDGRNSIMVQRKRPIKIPLCITIASRKQNCEGGIGFRCNLVSGGDCDLSERNQNANIIIDEKGTSLIITFSNKINWEKMY